MKILVTGGAGFIGSHFVDLLLSQHDISQSIEKVTVLDKLSYASNLNNLGFAFNDSRFEFIQGDICDVNSLVSVRENFDWIVNFAAESHVDNSLLNPQEFVLSNVFGTVHILEFAKRIKNCRVLHVSTDEVYGSVKIGSCDESYPINPSSPYSASKAAAEMFCTAYQKSHDIDVRITRSSNNFGPRQHSEKFIPTVIESIYSGNPIPIYGSGQNIRDWIYVKDNCMGIWSVMILGTPQSVYNLGGSNELDNLALVRKISKIMNVANPNIEYVKDRKGHDYRYSITSIKAERELNFVVSKDFEYNLLETIHSYTKRNL